MSMGLYVVLALTKAPTSDDINAGAKELSVPIVISTTGLSSYSGFLPMKVSGTDSGVEIDVYPAIEAADIIPKNGSLDIDSSIVFEFRWGGDFKEAAAAFYTAQVLTVKYNGIVYDPESGVFLDSEQVAYGAEVFDNLPK